MRAINHALTGTFIGLTVTVPIAAIPLAVASHYILDMVPHYGNKAHVNRAIRSSSFRNLLYIDALLCFGLVIMLAIGHPPDWRLAAICAFSAAAPDLLSFNRYRHVLARDRWHPGLYVQIASGIQWFERPIGAAVEVAWFVAAVVLLAPFIR